jgi:GNAT superfamily N-acetyltransferase
MNDLFIKCEKVDENNLAEAIRVQNTIFPKENGEKNLRDSISKNLLKLIDDLFYKKAWVYYLCLDDKNNIIGISGIYSFSQYPKDAWCGWFGILPKYQQKGYGEKLFLWTMDEARKLGFQNFRLYTGLIGNKNAVSLYRKVGMIEEDYSKEVLREKMTIFSKSLTSDEIDKWNNKMLYLEDQEKLYN